MTMKEHGNDSERMPKELRRKCARHSWFFRRSFITFQGSVLLFFSCDALLIVSYVRGRRVEHTRLWVIKLLRVACSNCSKVSLMSMQSRRPIFIIMPRQIRCSTCSTAGNRLDWFASRCLLVISCRPYGLKFTAITVQYVLRVQKRNKRNNILSNAFI